MKKKKVKISYKYCEFCGAKCIDKLRDNQFNPYTGKQLLWLQCPSFDLIKNETKGHSRWIKELVVDQEVE